MIVKSKLLKKISDGYPNFFKKDLNKFFNIFLNEIKEALKRGERVELRDFGMWSVTIQKPRISRNPKTGEKVHTNKKIKIRFKMAKEFSDKIQEWDFNDNIKRVLLVGEGNHFCAGGDVKSLFLTKDQNNHKKDFFKIEYKLNYLISQFKKEFLSIFDKNNLISIKSVAEQKFWI